MPLDNRNGNSGFDSLIVNYQVASNVYGLYTDTYLKLKDNPTMLNLTLNGHQVQSDSNETVVVPLRFASKGTILNYNPVPGLRALDENTQCSNEDATTAATMEESTTAATMEQSSMSGKAEI